jgi:hypothetical protein
MHLSDGTEIDLSAQVAKVKAKTRPWKSIIALVLAIGAAAACGWAHNSTGRFLTGDHIPYQILAIGLAVAFLALASAATLGLSAKAAQVLEPAIGQGHAAVVRYALVLIGAIATLLITLALLGIPLTQLLLGGALTSVFVGIAAQQSLSNVFSGMVLLLAHPFRVGDSIRMQAGALGGQICGTVTEIGITYVHLSTATGVISIPNSQVLNAVVGPLPDPATYANPLPPPPLMATPAGQPPPPALPLLAQRNQPKPAPDSEGGRATGDGSGTPDGQDESRPEVPPGTPEPRPSGTPT